MQCLAICLSCLAICLSCMLLPFFPRWLKPDLITELVGCNHPINYLKPKRLSRTVAHLLVLHDVWCDPGARLDIVLAANSLTDQWVSKRRELPGFSIVNEKTRPHPWDTHHKFSIKTLLSRGFIIDVNVHICTYIYVYIHVGICICICQTQCYVEM